VRISELTERVANQALTISQMEQKATSDAGVIDQQARELDRLRQTPASYSLGGHSTAFHIGPVNTADEAWMPVNGGNVVELDWTKVPSSSTVSSVITVWVHCRREARDFCGRARIMNVTDGVVARRQTGFAERSRQDD
jgi:hypothetical protein